MLTLLFVVLVLLGFSILKDKFKASRLSCYLGNHQWSMERGYEGAPHHTAVCKKCGIKPKEYN